MIKALPTTYNGLQFRSRTEARWAAYFDLMGVEWRYEDEAYELPSGAYLPDFYLPMHDVYAEVKGDAGFDLAAIRKAYELSKNSRRRVLLLDGPPANTTYLLMAGNKWFRDDEPDNDAVMSGDIDGDDYGGRLQSIYWFVPVNHRKNRFANGQWWTDFGGLFIGYGSQWMRAADRERTYWYAGDGPSVEATIVRNATTTRAGELIIRRRSS